MHRSARHTAAARAARAKRAGQTQRPAPAALPGGSSSSAAAAAASAAEHGWAVFATWENIDSAPSVGLPSFLL